MTDASNIPPKVFISHASADKDRFVLAFASRLRSDGVDAWVDRWEMNPGDSLVDKIFEVGLRECSAMIVVLSEHSILSRWVREELSSGMVRKIENSTRLIPVRLDECGVPECLRHSVWQDINDTTSYDAEYRRILNSIFGQYDKPPIGRAPLHVSDPAPAFEGIARIDAVILAAICRRAIETDVPFIQPDEFVAQMAAAGVTEAEIIEAQEVLEGKGILKIFRTGGPPQVHFMKITTLGFDVFAQTCIPEYGKLCSDVGRSLVRQQQMTNRALAAELKMPIRVVEHILEALQLNDLIKYWESKADGLYLQVHWVSPELRRMLER